MTERERNELRRADQRIEAGENEPEVLADMFDQLAALRNAERLPFDDVPPDDPLYLDDEARIERGDAI